ncbi:MAG: ABC transporter substrate-binding protein [Sphaerochaetaceae bacterium]
MKKGLFVFIVLISVVLLPLSSQAAREAQLAAEKVELKMAVMQGPSGFGVAQLFANEGKIANNISADISVYPSPNEVIARLANGELDVAFLPTNVAANLYSKGVKVKIAAVTGDGMLMFLTTDDSITQITDLNNRKIHIPGSGSTPDQLTRILISALGFDWQEDVELDYSIAAPAQLAQMMIANRVDLAVMPEPFVTMVLSSNKKATQLIDVQALWAALTGVENYPMTVVVISDAFVAKNPDKVAPLMDAIKESISWTVANPDKASQYIEREGIMKAEMAAPAIGRCNLVFRKAKEGFLAMDIYLKVLQGFDYTSIGGALPDESFYLDY